MLGHSSKVKKRRADSEKVGNAGVVPYGKAISASYRLRAGGVKTPPTCAT